MWSLCIVSYGFDVCMKFSRTLLNPTIQIARRYYINDKPSSFTDVGNLLRTKGVDLDNNRFLILQVRHSSPSTRTHLYPCVFFPPGEDFYLHTRFHLHPLKGRSGADFYDETKGEWTSPRWST